MPPKKKANRRTTAMAMPGKEVWIGFPRNETSGVFERITSDEARELAKDLIQAADVADGKTGKS